MVQARYIAVCNGRDVADDAIREGRWRVIVGGLLGLIGLGLLIIDWWPGALPDWLVDDVPNDD